MERRPDIGLDSSDRFFPSQDTLPSATMHNTAPMALISLPITTPSHHNAMVTIAK